MHKQIVFTGLCALVSMSSMAAGENNVGSCGWGSKLFEGQRGIAPQVLAVTTNGTSGNQTIGITLGTSGCTQDGVVSSNWKTALFINDNIEKLARDMSRGYGETLDSLANLLDIDGAHKPIFTQATKAQFAQIFSSEEATTKEVMAGLKHVLEGNTELARYAAALVIES